MEVTKMAIGSKINHIQNHLDSVAILSEKIATYAPSELDEVERLLQSADDMMVEVLGWLEKVLS